jgi:hypothetical protein
LTTGSNTSAFGNNAATSLTTGVNNSAFGNISLFNCTIGSSNSAFGDGSMQLLTTGSRNASFGVGSIASITTGSDHVAIGYSAGGNYTLGDSNNICIGSSVGGTVGESNTIRIGHSSHTRAFITGTLGVTPSGTPEVVTIGTGGQIGSTTVTALKNNYNVTYVNSSPYTVLATDTHIVINATGGVIINLPFASTKRNLIINDNGNGGFVNNITIQEQLGDSIGVTGPLVIATQWGSKHLYSDGVTNWWVN